MEDVANRCRSELRPRDRRRRLREGLRRQPRLYGDLGVQELVIFDPHVRPDLRSRRVRWQVYRRIRRRGLVRVEVMQSDRVRSKNLGVWLRAVGAGEDVRVRLALGPHGDDLYPTEAEAERAAKEQERAQRLRTKRRSGDCVLSSRSDEPAGSAEATFTAWFDGASSRTLPRTDTPSRSRRPPVSFRRASTADRC